MEDLLRWWPLIVGFTGGLVWLVRLESKVIAGRASLEALAEREDAWRVAHAAEIAPQVRRIDEALERLERGQERAAEHMGEIRERLVGVEKALNGAHIETKPWDKRERRRA